MTYGERLATRRLAFSRASIRPIVDPRPLRPAKLHSIYGDEYDQGVLDGSWSTQGTLPTGLALAGSSWASAQFNNTNQYVYRPAPSGDFTLSGAAQIVGPGNNSNQFGLVALDDSGNGVAVIAYDNTDRLYIVQVAAGVQSGGFQFIGSENGTPYQVAGLLGHYRIIKSGTSYTGQFGNRQGTAWSAASDSVTGPSTITRIGWGKTLGSTATTVRFDWIDVS